MDNREVNVVLYYLSLLLLQIYTRIALAIALNVSGAADVHVPRLTVTEEGMLPRYHAHVKMATRSLRSLKFC